MAFSPKSSICKSDYLPTNINFCPSLGHPANPASNSPAVKASSHLTLKAVYSRSLKSAQSLAEAAGAIDLYSEDSGAGKSFHDLLLRPDIHAVILALPILSQPEYIEAALAAGKHVLSEKPIAGDIKRAEKLIEYYKSDKVKGGATWAIAENYRFLDSIIFATQEARKLGKVLGFRTKMFHYVNPGDKYFGRFFLRCISTV